MRKDTLFIFDIDNTLVCPHAIYDEAYRLASKAVIGIEFIATRNPDGTSDKTFTKENTHTILRKRLEQLGIDKKQINPKDFFRKLEETAYTAVQKIDFLIYEGVFSFISELTKGTKAVILTSGPKSLQLEVLRKSGLEKYFELENSIFLNTFISKKEGIERIFNKYPDFKNIIHLGDSPEDMKATKEAQINVKKIAAGVTIQGLSSKKELLEAGADLIIDKYDDLILNQLLELANS